MSSVMAQQFFLRPWVPGHSPTFAVKPWLLRGVFLRGRDEWFGHRRLQGAGFLLDFARSCWVMQDLGAGPEVRYPDGTQEPLVYCGIGCNI